MQLPFIYYAPLTVACDIIFAVGCCYLLSTFADDIRADVSDLNEQCQENDAKFNQRLGKLIEFHSAGKQLSIKEYQLEIHMKL